MFESLMSQIAAKIILRDKRFNFQFVLDINLSTAQIKGEKEQTNSPNKIYFFQADKKIKVQFYVKI